VLQKEYLSATICHACTHALGQSTDFRDFLATSMLTFQPV